MLITSKKLKINKNPLIQDLHQEYLQFSNARILNRQTLFCKYKYEL